MKKIGFLNKAKNKSAGMTLEQIIDFFNLGGVPKDKLSEATYFACLKILSESIGKLPLKLMQHTADGGVVKASKHYLYNLVKDHPNPFMTSTSFWGAVEYNRNHYGNAYVLIKKPFSSNTSLWILPSEKIEIWYDDKKLLSDVPKLWYIYTDDKTGGKYKYSHEQIMHFKSSTTFDGITALSVAETLVTTVEGAQKAEKLLGKMYENGFVARAAVQYTGNLNEANAAEFAKIMTKFARGEHTGAEAFIPIPLGAEIKPLNINFTDAQFLEIKKYTALQIAAAFGIKPNQINDFEKSSYASAEAQQLAFYVDTLLYILKQYEEELTYKLLSDEERASGLYFKFNVSVILRADLKTQMESLTSAVAGGLMTPDEARAMLDLQSKGCNDLICNGNMIKVSQAGMAYNNQ